MQRAFLGWGFAGLLAVSLGCSMCGHPYDYCSPTYTGGPCGGNCDTRTRTGSILAPAGAPVAGPIAGPMMGGEVPGGPMISNDAAPQEFNSPGQEVIQEESPVQQEPIKPTPIAPGNRSATSAARPQG
jgi:hypothetical protein